MNFTAALRLATAALMMGPALLSAAPTIPPGKAGKPSGKNTVNFERAKEQIDALLAPRLKPTPLPDPLPNPFQVAEAPTPATTEKEPKGATTPEALPPSSDSEMLLYYGANLRISGTVTIEDRTHLVINQVPYKEGDAVTLKTKDGPVKLRVVTIRPGEVTLALGETVQVIKFKK